MTTPEVLAAAPAETPSLPLTEWIRALPKAQVHVHAEGCIPLAVLAPAALAAGDPELAAGPPALSGGLGPFLGHLDRSCRLMTEPAQLEAIAVHIAETALAQGSIYTEVIVNPTHWPSWQGRRREFVEAFDRGFSRAEDAGAPPSKLLLSTKRNQTAEEALELATWIVQTGHPRIVGLSIDGNEHATGRTGERFAAAFTYARDHGLHRAVHAGESSGPEGVLDALDLLHAERIDHGVRSIEDPGLLDRLRDERVPLDVCPSSNVILEVVDSIAAHPVKTFFEHGIPVTLNTDDPELFVCSLTGEYAKTAAAFGWSRADLARLAQNSIEASFAPAADKRAMVARLAAFIAATL